MEIVNNFVETFMNLSLKEIYTKYRSGDLLTTDEVEFGIQHFKKLADICFEIGPEFKITGNGAYSSS